METEQIEKEELDIEKEENLPEFFQPGYVERVVDALPYYFPNYLKERLKREHPDIPVSSKEIEQEDSYLYYNTGRKYLYSGAHHLNEMLVESLTMSILTDVNNYSETNTPYMEDLFEPFLSDYGRNDTTLELIQHMQVAMLSGDFRKTNEFLREEFNISIFDFLRDFNRKLKDEKYISQQNEKEENSISGKFLRDPLQIYILPLFQECLDLQKKLLFTSKRILEIDRISLNRKEILKDKEHIQHTEKEIKEMYASIARTGIHETLHYLSFNPSEERIGFKFDNQSDLYRLSQTY